MQALVVAPTPPNTSSYFHLAAQILIVIQDSVSVTVHSNRESVTSLLLTLHAKESINTVPPDHVGFLTEFNNAHQPSN